jgi:hypothetical protein
MLYFFEAETWGMHKDIHLTIKVTYDNDMKYKCLQFVHWPCLPKDFVSILLKQKKWTI